jgi:hypothetical protein
MYKERKEMKMLYLLLDIVYYQYTVIMKVMIDVVGHN